MFQLPDFVLLRNDQLDVLWLPAGAPQKPQVFSRNMAPLRHGLIKHRETSVAETLKKVNGGRSKKGMNARTGLGEEDSLYYWNNQSRQGRRFDVLAMSRISDSLTLIVAMF